jgi:ribosome maturation factor RimP
VGARAHFFIWEIGSLAGAAAALRSEGGLESRIEALIQPVVTDMGFVLVRVRFIAGGRPRLQIMAERPDGRMSVEDCAQLSRALSALLDIEDPIPGEYVLEVSSPGLDRPLVKPADFLRFKGREAKIELAGLLGGRKRFKGRLGGLEFGAGGEEVILEEEGGAAVALPVRLIDEAKLVLSDELIARSLKGGQVPLEEGAEVDVNRQGKARQRKKREQG